MNTEKREVAISIESPDEQKLVTEHLASLGYEILAYHEDGGTQADLFILDVPSARRIGDDVLSIKKSSDTFLPVIVLLGKDDDINPWLSAGFDNCLRMPFTKSEIKANVEILLRLRQQSEEITQRSKARYQAIFEATGTATLIVEEDATIVMANRTCLSSTGYSPEELIGTKWIRYVAPESLEMMLRYHKLRREDSEKAPFQYEVKLVNKAGEVRNVILQVSMVPETRQSVVSMLDITERKQAEIELNRQIEILQRIFDHIPIMITYLDERGNIKIVNHELVKKLGWALDEWKAENILAKCYPEPEALKEALDFMISKPIAWKDFKTTTKYGTVIDTTWTNIQLADGVSMGIGQDITERKQAEKALRLSENRFRALFEQTGVGVAVIDSLTGRFVQINQKYCDIVGYSPEEMLATTFQSITHPDDLKSDLDNMQLLREGRIRQFSIEKRYYHKGGWLVWVNLTVSPLWQEGESTVFHIAVVEDITKRKQAEEEQARQQQLLMAINRAAQKFMVSQDKSSVFYNLLTDIIAITDSEYGFIGEVLLSPNGQPYLKTHAITNIAWNDETRTFYEENSPKGLEFYNLKTLFGATLASGEVVIANDPLHDPRRGGLPKGHPPLNAYLGLPIKSAGKLVSMLGIANRPNGYDHDLINFLQPLLNTIGQLVEAQHNERERKQAEEALHESEETYRRLFEEHSAVKWFIDPDSGDIVDANKAAADFYGWSREELKQMKIQQINILPPEEIKKEIEKARTLKKTHFEFRHRLADGSIRDVRVFSSKIEIKGKDYLHSIIQDVTKEKEIEAQLHQSQKLESIGQLAGGVAHDFNNILNVILGYGEIMLNKLHHGDPLREDARQIVEAGKRSMALTHQLLAFSRKQILQPKVLNINESLKTIDKMLRRLIGEDIDLVMELAEDISYVKADPAQIDQIVMNLTVNARDAMPYGGKLIIETANVVLDESYTQNHAGAVPGDYVMIAVTDTGSGMDKETLSKIFEPFFTTKGKDKSTGLGLSTVYGIVKQSGGNIYVYSELGKGTTFKIYLPAAFSETQLEEEQTKKDEYHGGGGEHILVVEDEPALQGLFETLLSDLGYRVTVAANGGEALLLVEEKGVIPDLVITDVIMPVMSGDVLVNRLRKNQPDIKVLYMSGYTDNAIAHHGVLDKDVPFIQKPFNINQLAEMIKQLMRQK